MTTESEDPSLRFLPRIRQELDKLSLTEEQKDAAEHRLLRDIRFLDTRNGREEAGGQLQTDSSVFHFADRVAAVAAHFGEDGLTVTDYVRAAVRQPQLFYQLPETIARNIEGVVAEFQKDGLNTREYLKAAVTEPPLFTLTPATVAANVRGVFEHFARDGLTLKDYLKAALMRPSLFTQSPATIISNIETVVNHFQDDGLTTPACIRAACKNPSLFGQSPGTIIANIEGVAERFADEGLSVRDCVKAAIKQPELWSRTSATVARHITEVAERYENDGLNVRNYLKAARTQPALFAMSEETIIRHIDTVINLAEKGIFTPPAPRRRATERTEPTTENTRAAVIRFLMSNPNLMCLADDNFGVREVHQRLTDGPTDSKLFRLPRYAVERELMSHLGHDDPQQPVPNGGFVAGTASPTKEQAERFVLRALMHAGFIKGGSMER